MPKAEQVLVFKKDLINKLGLTWPAPITHNTSEVQDLLFGILSRKNIQGEDLLFIDKDMAEHDENYKQLIPYQVLKHNNKYFVYERATKGGEARLHNKLSLGIGGHINSEDTDNNTFHNYPLGSYNNGKKRELNEEIPLNGTPYVYKTVAALYDDSTEVGRVHFGFIHVYELENTLDIHVTDNKLNPKGWWTREQLIEGDGVSAFESWSQIVIDNLIKNEVI